MPLYIQIPTLDVGAPATVIDPDPDMRSHGIGWARLINSVGEYIRQRSANTFLSVVGANDIELPWNTPQQTRLWVNGYIALANYPFYNVGSCDGCPERLADAPAGGEYAWKWTAADLWAVSAQERMQVVPQIYNETGAQARQWATLAQMLKTTFDPLTFAGVLTQYDACQDRKTYDPDPCPGIENRPPVGWSQLDQELRDRQLGPGPNRLTDVRWEFVETRFYR